MLVVSYPSDTSSGPSFVVDVSPATSTHPAAGGVHRSSASGWKSPVLLRLETLGTEMGNTSFQSEGSNRVGLDVCMLYVQIMYLKNNDTHILNIKII